MKKVFDWLRDDRKPLAKRTRSVGISSACPIHSIHSPNPRMRNLERMIPLESVYRQLAKANLTPLAEFRGTTLKELPDVDPLAFATRAPNGRSPCDFTAEVPTLTSPMCPPNKHDDQLLVVSAS